jgi:small conductance mechanosensitive channel
MKREFNRRMKNRFDELGIEIPFPQRTITFGEDVEGNAVAGRIAAEHERTAAQPAAAGKARIDQDKGAATDGDGSD